MSNYENSPACRMLATHCVVCGRALVDSVSVELGIGPECRSHFNGDLSPEMQKVANGLVYEAAIAAQQGKVPVVLALADRIERECLMGELAEKIRTRFTGTGVQKAERNPDITITEEGDMLVVRTPFRRKEGAAFIQAWQVIPGRRYDRARRVNIVPVSQAPALRELLRRFFMGKYVLGRKGLWRVSPAPVTAVPTVPAQA
jgi:hypothetical protein